MEKDADKKDEEPSNLCSRCCELDFDSIFDRTLRDDEVHQRFSLLDAAQNKHCALCTFIFDVAEDYLSQHKVFEPRDVHCEIGNVFLARYPTGLTYSDDSAFVNRMVIRFRLGSPTTSEVETRSDAEIQRDGSFRDPRSFVYRVALDRVGYNQMTGTSAMVRRIVPKKFDIATLRQWLEVDARQHDQPLEKTNESLSTLIGNGRFRVIDVLSGNIEVPKVPVRYLALSYVWGKRTPEQVSACQLPLTKSCSILELDHIPRTIRESLEFVRKIGERYLWIDAVCIDQADPNDKAALISNMGAIYASAYLTIIAAKGKDANSVLGRLMGHGHIAEQPLVLRKGGKATSLILSRPLTPEVLLRETRWGSRAWTYQEWLLSTRCLISSRREVMFHSEHIEAREAYAFRDPYTMNEDDNPATNATDENLAHDPNFGISTSPSLSFAQDTSYDVLIGRYSGKNLTYPGDRLDAFNGVARRVAGDNMSPEQIATLSGLPKDLFASSLAWFRDDRGVKANRILKDHRQSRFLPSWSWVGWEGAVYSYPIPDSESCEIKDEANILCNLAGTPWNVEPTLNERTPILQVTLHLWTKLVVCRFDEARLWNEKNLHSIFVANASSAQTFTSLQETIDDCQISILDLAELRVGATYFLVPVDDMVHYDFKYLILKKHGSFYERAGIFSISSISGSATALDIAVQQLDDWASEPSYIQVR